MSEALLQPNARLAPCAMRHALPKWNLTVMEKRKFTRFRTQENCYAALSGNFSKVGKICDICTEGIAFKYLAWDIREEEFSRVDIFLVKSGFHLFKLPCRIVYNAPEESFGKGFLAKMYRCGLEFMELTKSQAEQLKLFMQNYTTEAVGP
jgi:PilZ domain